KTSIFLRAPMAYPGTVRDEQLRVEGAHSLPSHPLVPTTLIGAGAQPVSFPQHLLAGLDGRLAIEGSGVSGISGIREDDERAVNVADEQRGCIRAVQDVAAPLV